MEEIDPVLIQPSEIREGNSIDILMKIFNTAKAVKRM